MGHTNALLTGLAELIASAGLGVWRTSGAYTDPEVGIVLDVFPQSPANVISLSGYSVGDDPVYADSVDGVQIRTRRDSLDPRPVNDLADGIFDLLHGATGLTLGGVRTVSIRRTSWAPLGADQQQRHERSDNYYIESWRPATHRL